MSHKPLPRISRIGNPAPALGHLARESNLNPFRHQHPDTRTVAQWQFDCARKGNIIEIDRHVRKDL